MENQRWSIIDSTYILKDKWLSLRADKCRTPEGSIIEPYYILEYPTWVNVVAMTRENEIVLVRQYRHGLGKTLLGLPSGTVDPGDASPARAIERELSEETGYTSNNFKETGRLSVNPANHTNVTHCFLATDVYKIGNPHVTESEYTETVLMSVEDLLEYVRKCDVFQALHLGSLWFALRELGLRPSL